MSILNGGHMGSCGIHEVLHLKRFCPKKSNISCFLNVKTNGTQWFGMV